METPIKRDERIEFRVSAEEKKMFRRAQKLNGDSSISSFITRVLRAKSAQIIQENEDILASKEDREIFFQAIFADIEPNKALSAAAERFKSSKK